MNHLGLMNTINVFLLKMKITLCLFIYKVGRGQIILLIKYLLDVHTIYFLIYYQTKKINRISQKFVSKLMRSKVIEKRKED